MALRALGSACAAATAIVLGASPARSAPPDDGLAVGSALLAGTGAALVPFAIGAGIAAGSKTLATKNAGVVLANGGLVLGPIVSHAIVGEWGRGFAFAAVPAASTLGNAFILAAEPGTVFGDVGPAPELTVLFVVSVFGSAVGVVDTAFAVERARAVRLSPRVGAGSVGVDVRVSL